MAEDLLAFARAVLSHCVAYGTGGVVAFAVFLLERLTKWKLTGAAHAAIFFWAFVLVATFSAWREERVRRPGPNVVTYDGVIRPDQDWHLKVEDRNNPKKSFEVLIGRRRLTVTLTNNAGLSRTGLERSVRFEGAPETDQ